ncbi:MAG: SDR family NAD(P)-dependent oxidoreductase [SAR324 cluster bacterium]|nr:SDR family NAD(P)-dependent oxidoreductase [SAR324 cluster bacterium]
MATVTVIAGVGPGNGAHFARRFAKGGHAVALLARSRDYLEQLAGEISAEGGQALAVPMDIADQASVAGAFAQVRSQLGEVEHLIQNAALGQRGPFMEIPPEGFLAGFEVSVMGMVYCCREVLGPMEKRGSGSIILIGATAAFRGGSGFSSFAVSKFGQRALAQSIAREYGPRGVHVAHLNIDGVIESERSLQRLPDKEQQFFLQPKDIAESVWYLAHQPRSTWTHDLDLRPHVEKW